MHHVARCHHRRLPLTLLSGKISHVPRAEMPSDCPLLRLDSVVDDDLRPNTV